MPEGTLDGVEPTKQQMLDLHLRGRDITDERVLAAFADLPREPFMPPGSADRAYVDAPTPIGFDQTISQPYIVAYMLQQLQVEPHHKVLDVGTGSGYQAALLAKLARVVYTVEVIKPLLDAAFERLGQLGLRNVHFRHTPQTLGWPEAAPFDRIAVAASATSLPEAFLRTQLADGGIALLPVGDELLRVTKADDLQVETLCPVRFVPLV